MGSSPTCCTLFVVTVALQLLLLLQRLPFRFFSSFFSPPQAASDQRQTLPDRYQTDQTLAGDELAIWQTSNAGPLDPGDPVTRLGIMCKDVSISVFSLAPEVDFP